MAPAVCGEISKITPTFKKAGDLEIKADVYQPANAARDGKRPVVVWIHGGALINGHRESVPKWLLEGSLAQGWNVVSIDYRLAPETQLPEIVADLDDAFRWVREKGPELFAADPERVAAIGGSAGGYMTLTAGFRAKPKPVALVSLWGYGDLVGPWYSEPSPHPRHRTSQFSREEAYKQVSGPPISDSRDRQGDGGAFYQYCRQTGTWPKAVSGWDPHKEPEKFHPYMALKNVTADYPPTLLIHGDQDTDVPYEQSTLMAAELKKHGVEHQLITLKGAEHGLAGGGKAEIDAAYAAAIEFLKKHLAPGPSK
ncbi:MAG TPA: alpha/beta hydrolase [Pirellulaceae bacterium]|nr:alpha/beta hydrolase [Pirellulaceae bacterium]